MGRRDAADVLWRGGAAIRQMIGDEILCISDQQRALKAQGRIGHLTLVILVFCILFDITCLFILDNFFALFITASFYLYMVYFITLLVPLGTGTLSLPSGRIRQLFSALHHTGIIPASDRITRIFLDAFYINSRALFGGFLFIFSCDLVFAATAFFQKMFAPFTMLVILFQSLAILAFYFIVWKFEPYSAGFRQDIAGIKEVLISRRYPPWVITFLFGTAAVTVLLVILSTIILLPGFTVKTLLTHTGLEQAGHLASLLCSLFASQYFIVRFIHGISSARMASEFSDAKIFNLQAAGTVRNPEQALSDGSDVLQGPSADAVCRAAGALLDSKIYRIERRTIYGAFPVYIVNPDLSVILDVQVLAEITGYLRHAGSCGSEKH